MAKSEKLPVYCKKLEVCVQKLELCAKSSFFVIRVKKPHVNMLMKLMPGVKFTIQFVQCAKAPM
jgi:hypothetical protein